MVFEYKSLLVVFGVGLFDRIECLDSFYFVIGVSYFYLGVEKRVLGI